MKIQRNTFFVLPYFGPYRFCSWARFHDSLVSSRILYVPVWQKTCLALDKRSRNDGGQTKCTNSLVSEQPDSLPASYNLRPVAFVLPTTYYLLPTGRFLLPMTYYRPPITRITRITRITYYQNYQNHQNNYLLPILITLWEC